MGVFMSLKEEYFAMSNEEFEQRAIKAARENDSSMLRLINDAIEQHWLLAVAGSHHEKLEISTTRLCHITDRLKPFAETLASPSKQYVSDWNLMFRLGYSLLQSDVGYNALKRLRMANIPHAEAVLEFMSQKTSTFVEDIAAHFAFGASQPNEIMRQLHEYGFVTILGRNWYVLTASGMVATRRMKKEKQQLETAV